MMEAIKKRPLSQYYLWRVCQNYTEGEKEDSEILTVKKVIGQLKAERRNLEKLNDQTISVHISSLAFLEESLKELSEESLQTLLQEVQKKYLPSEAVNEKKWGLGHAPKLKTKKGKFENL
ncbi:hypothetical protein [Enterococcus sp. AZ126]|uniref:hypothetical protein n=1 Tax=Enterococcus sp. AZ126 TaxID=2774635 RepID=UPI003F682400